MQRFISCALVLGVVLMALVPNLASGAKRGFVRGQSSHSTGSTALTGRFAGQALQYRQPMRMQLATPRVITSRSMGALRTNRGTVGSVSTPQFTTNQQLRQTTLPGKYVPSTSNLSSATSQQSVQQLGQAITSRTNPSTVNPAEFVRPRFPSASRPRPLAREQAPLANRQQPIPGTGPDLPPSFQLDQKIDKELDEPFPPAGDGGEAELGALLAGQDRIITEIAYALDQGYPFQLIEAWINERWAAYRRLQLRIDQIRLANAGYRLITTIPVAELPPVGTGGMGGTPESDNPSGGGSPKEQGSVIKMEEQVVTLGGRGTRPGRGRTLGGGGGGGGTNIPGGAPQKGDDGGGGGNDNDGPGGWEYPQVGGGGDHDSRPRSSDNSGGGGDAGDDDDNAGEGGGGGDDGGTTTYEPRSAHDPWGYIKYGDDVQAEHTGAGLPPAEEGGGTGGNDVGAAGKLSRPAPGVTPQEKDLVGPAIGTATGPDDKERPNVGHPSQTTSDPNNDLGDDLPGNRRRGFGAGGESTVGFREVFYQWLGIDPGITYEGSKDP